MTKETSIKLFEQRQIRSTWDESIKAEERFKSILNNYI